ncbi:MAG: hypothetical protein EBR01_11065 [Proteobacteria bacterium]|nr:hypothetical protein [Pseudomonadota bacterium]NBY21030.1 hypothetical protein [bacterium]
MRYSPGCSVSRADHENLIQKAKQGSAFVVVTCNFGMVTWFSTKAIYKVNGKVKFVEDFEIVLTYD